MRLYEPGQVPDVRSVARTNFCDMGIQYDARTGRAVIVAAIDNLGKGAAGQAVQNMNLALGFRGNGGPAVRDADQNRRHAARCGGIASAAGCGDRRISRDADVAVVHGGGKQMTRYLASAASRAGSLTGCA